jgi:hypothetical protein
MKAGCRGKISALRALADAEFACSAKDSPTFVGRENVS